MKKVITAGLMLAATLVMLQNGDSVARQHEAGVTSPGSHAQAMQNLSAMPLTFTENHGQWDDKIQFRSNAVGVTMWFASDGAYYQFTRSINPKDAGPMSVMDKRHGKSSDKIEVEQAGSIETMMIKAAFVGANLNPRMTGLNMVEYTCNYFIGDKPDQWIADVPNYTSILYNDIYEGIDLKYFGNGTQMEYDFMVSPGADYSRINIQYEGVESISTNSDGELIVKTEWGEVIERRPVVYQMIGDKRVFVDGMYEIRSLNSFGFSLTGYDPELPVVIDPVLSYSTYLGGSNTDYAFDIAVDASGSAYVTGYTWSSDFPTLNPYLGTHQGGNKDIFVTKLSSSGSGLEYSTYLGGSLDDIGYGITVDASGAAYITGNLKSTNYPTLNPFQESYQGGTYDAFVTKLSSSGNSLIYSTYLGGGVIDYGTDIKVDASGAAYVTGRTSSTNFPMLNPIQGTFQGGSYDLFVTKLSSAGNSLDYSTYLGGSDVDYGWSIALDTSGSAYVTGQTWSTDFITLNPFQATKDSASYDAFVAKLTASGTGLVYSTFLGGSDRDLGYGIAVDASGAAYVTGRTYSNDFPVLNPYQATHHTDTYDIFVTKLASSGTSLLYSTYLGGTGNDYGYGIAIDASGVAYLTGYTGSTDYPMLDAYQNTHQGILFDAFFTRLSSSGNSLLYSTYMGGSLNDHGRSIAVDGSGAAYITGWTFSNNFPMLNSYQETYQGGNTDTFVAKFGASECPIALTGDLNTSGTLNLADIVSLINYVLKGGLDPVPCSAAGDVNCSGTVNLADIVYLVNHVLKAGPAPCDVCSMIPSTWSCP